MASPGRHRRRDLGADLEGAVVVADAHPRAVFYAARVSRPRRTSTSTARRAGVAAARDRRARWRECSSACGRRSAGWDAAAGAGQRLPARQHLVGLHEPRVIDVELLAAGQRRPGVLALDVDARRARLPPGSTSLPMPLVIAPASDGRRGIAPSRRASSHPTPPVTDETRRMRVDHLTSSLATVASRPSVKRS